jgi:hypothetical protein
MKVLTDNLATSLLGGIAVVSIGAIIAVLPALLSGNGASSGGVLVQLLTGAIFFPCWVAMMLFERAGAAVIPAVALLALALTLVFWTGVIHGVRLLLRHQT